MMVFLPSTKTLCLWASPMEYPGEMNTFRRVSSQNGKVVDPSNQNSSNIIARSPSILLTFDRVGPISFVLKAQRMKGNFAHYQP